MFLSLDASDDSSTAVGGRERYVLPVSKLRGVPPTARGALKRNRINTCERLLDEAGSAAKRAEISRRTGLDPELLLRLVQRADLARVNGIGAVFGMMLENLGIRDVNGLARQDPVRLHAQLRGYNSRERLARRAPTPEEVARWIAQARGLPRLVET